MKKNCASSWLFAKMHGQQNIKSKKEVRSHLIFLITLRIKRAKCLQQKRNILQLPTRVQTGLALFYIVMVTVFFKVSDHYHMWGDIFKQGKQCADNGMPLVTYITHTGVILQTLLIRYNVSG